jgi:phage baseplate assembly protein W
MASKILGITLPVQRGSNGYFQVTKDILTQIRSNLKNLLLTRKGERVMQPEYGCDIHLVIFENATDDGLSDIRASIQNAVSTWMPFVEVTDVKVTRDEDRNTIYVGITFTLLTNQNLTDSIVLEFK